MTSAQSNASNASPVHRITPGSLIGWFLFSFITLTIGIMALPQAARYYDFRAFYTAGYLVLHHPSQLFNLQTQGLVQDALVAPIHPALPYYHPAFEALLYAPLALLTYRTAYILYAVFNLLLLAVCYCVAPQPVDPRLAKYPRPLLFFLSFPAFFCVAHGQDSILFLLLLCLVWRALSRGHDIAAGILLALGLFKVQLVVVLVIFLAARRGTRILRSFLPSAVVLAALSLAITGLQGAAEWIHLLTSAFGALNGAHSAQVLIAVHPKAMPTMNGLVYILGGGLLPPRASWILDLILGLATFVVALVLVRRSRSLSEAFAAAIAGTVLISPHLYIQDCVLLALAVLLITGTLSTVAGTIYCVLPFILFAIHGIDWLAPMAILPVAILLVFLVSAERSEIRLPQTLTETVTSAS